MVAVRDEHDLCPLLNTACAFARAQDGEVYLLTVTPSGILPSWLKLPPECEDIYIETLVRAGQNVAPIILDAVQQLNPDRLLLGWSGELGRDRYLLGRTLDPVIRGAPCDVLVLRGQCRPEVRRVLIPAAGGPNAPYAFEIAHALAPEAEITALYVASERLGQAEILVGRDRLDMLMRVLPDSISVTPRVIRAVGPVEGILQEAGQGYDLLLLGAGNENFVGRYLFGDIPQAILSRMQISDAPIPVIVVRRHLSDLGSLARKLWVSIFGLVPALTTQERAEVTKNVQRGARPSTDFFVMITLASAIASLGLLLNSPAVIIGAMLVAPLMTAILGMGLSLVLGDHRFFWTSLGTTLRGVMLAMLTGALIGFLVPGASITQEMLNRGNPSVLDLGVALVSGGAAVYVLSRRDVSAALAGVAIAAALAPPLTTVGICAVLRDWRTAGGALLLFVTNMISIVAAGGVTFFMLGFRPEPGDPNRSMIQRRGFRSVAVLLISMTVLLGALTEQSLYEYRFNRAVEQAIRSEVAQIPGGELVNWQVEQGEAETLYLDVTMRVLTPLDHSEAESLQERIAERLDAPVALSLGMVPATRLQAYIPPTPTNTPTATPTGLPTATPTSTPTPTPTATPTPLPTSTSTPTATPTPTSTPLPTITPYPTATPTPTPWILFVVNVNRNGLRVHYSPGGTVMGILPKDAPVTVIGGPVELNDVAWYRVVSANQLEGWVTVEFLGTPTPLSTLTPAP